MIVSYGRSILSFDVVLDRIDSMVGWISNFKGSTFSTNNDFVVT